MLFKKDLKVFQNDLFCEYVKNNTKLGIHKYYKSISDLIKVYCEFMNTLHFDYYMNTFFNFYKKSK